MQSFKVLLVTLLFAPSVYAADLAHEGAVRIPVYSDADGSAVADSYTTLDAKAYDNLARHRFDEVNDEKARVAAPCNGTSVTVNGVTTCHPRKKINFLQAQPAKEEGHVRVNTDFDNGTTGAQY